VPANTAGPEIARERGSPPPRSGPPPRAAMRMPPAAALLSTSLRRHSLSLVLLGVSGVREPRGRILLNCALSLAKGRDRPAAPGQGELRHRARPHANDAACDGAVVYRPSTALADARAARRERVRNSVGLHWIAPLASKDGSRQRTVRRMRGVAAEGRGGEVPAKAGRSDGRTNLPPAKAGRSANRECGRRLRRRCCLQPFDCTR
jgi:hypothetical protein